MSRSLPRQVTLAPGVVWHQLDDELVLLHLETETYHGLNEVGSVMLRTLIETGAPESIVASVVAAYEVDAEKVRKDLATLLDKLQAAQLIVIEE